MAKKKYTIRFLNLVDDSKTRTQEVSTEKVLERFRRGETLNLIDVREEREYLLSHIGSSRHMGRGVLEREIEKFYKNLDEELILYCQQGYRAILAADSLQKMGYSRVYAMTGGFALWKQLGGPISLA